MVEHVEHVRVGGGREANVVGGQEIALAPTPQRADRHDRHHDLEAHRAGRSRRHEERRVARRQWHGLGGHRDSDVVVVVGVVVAAAAVGDTLLDGANDTSASRAAARLRNLLEFVR